MIFGAMALASDDSISMWTTAVCVAVLLLLFSVVHGVMLVWLTVRRIKSGANTIAVTLYQILSFLVSFGLGGVFVPGCVK